MIYTIEMEVAEEVPFEDVAEKIVWTNGLFRVLRVFPGQMLPDEDENGDPL